MGLKIKTGLLLCLMSAAVCSCLAAYRSMHFSSSAVPTPLTVTPIGTACLRTADRAMLRGGIPVESEDELLMLLEDLGS